RAMLERIIAEKWLTARGVFALWPAQSVGDDVVVRHDGGEATLHFLRQQVDKPADRPDFCLADFIAPRDSGRQDWIGMFAVTAGIGIEPHLERFQADHDDYNAILLRPWPTAWPRPSPNACTSACAPSTGATPPTRR